MDNFGAILRQQRQSEQLTLEALAEMTGVSPSHLYRIEAGERFPSARILKKLARPLGFDENELFTLAGFLSPKPGISMENSPYSGLDPFVARALSREPVETQRALLTMLAVLKKVTRTFSENSANK